MIEEMKDKDPEMWNVVSPIPPRNPKSRVRELSEKSCDICGEEEDIVLTKHHYTRNERSLRNRKRLSFPNGRTWDWRCANCHLAFNKSGTKPFYAAGGYQEKHQMTAPPRPVRPTRLVARYTRSTGVLERFERERL